MTDIDCDEIVDHVNRLETMMCAASIHWFAVGGEIETACFVMKEQIRA